MNFAKLQKAGAFVSKKPVAKEIVWEHEVDGAQREDKFTIYIRRLSAGDAEKLYTGTKDTSLSATVISECIRTDESSNTPLLTYDQAYQLDTGLSRVFLDAINEVNSPKN